ncbi:MAG: hypothetical protein V1707_02345 [bacterium]
MIKLFVVGVVSLGLLTGSGALAKETVSWSGVRVTGISENIVSVIRQRQYYPVAVEPTTKILSGKKELPVTSIKVGNIISVIGTMEDDLITADKIVFGKLPAPKKITKAPVKVVVKKNIKTAVKPVAKKQIVKTASVSTKK